MIAPVSLCPISKYKVYCMVMFTDYTVTTDFKLGTRWNFAAKSIYWPF